MTEGVDSTGHRNRLATYFFLVFDKPVVTNYKRAFSETSANLQFQFIDVSVRSMVVATPTDPIGQVVEFQFSETPL
jgi:hypothetical protein